ncbi:MAG: hypothetical protein K5656_11430 [Lachnospiraceae bacterium]|nr:hypothetical protein [Lachnospiraceae bacterium]
MMSNKAEQFVQKLEDVSKSVKALKRETNRLSIGRLVSFAIGACGLIIGLADSNTVGIVVGALAIVVFAVLVYISADKNDKLHYYEALYDVYERYVKRFSNEWTEFDDDGVEFLEYAPTYIKEVSMDLDIFGENSLFQYINVAASKIGRTMLAKVLTLAFDSSDNEESNAEKLDKQFMVSKLAIEERQEAVDELLKNEELSYKLEALSQKAKKSSKKAMNSSIPNLKESDEDKKFSLVIAILASILTAAAWISVILAAFKIVSVSIPVILFVVIFVLSQFMDGVLFSKSYEAFGCLEFLAAYEQYFYEVAKAEFESQALLRIKKEIAKDADKGILGLRTIGNAIMFRSNPLVYGLLCTACFYNAFVYLSFTRWRHKYEKRVPKWINAAGEMEMYLSLSVIGRVKTVRVFPEIVEESSSTVNFKEMCHPLINEDQVVGNDCAMDSNLLIITGSNMSGKTTYLRTLGVNVILAYSGSMVLSKRAKLSVMRLFTSMRVVDDVGRGISSFYAEVLRIKTMVSYIDKHTPMLVLIDEIFKGTNSADRIIGAKGVIGTLAKPWITGMITTHDFELCSLAENHKQIINYHFDEYFENDELKFEYKLKEERCTTTNALQILKMAGITQ